MSTADEARRSMDDVFSSLRKLLGRGKPAEEPGPET